MAKDIDINVQDAIWKLRREFSNLTGGQFNLAVARAINHTLAKAKTSAGRDIRTVYKIKAKDLTSKMALVKATSASGTGMIKVFAKPLPIMAFGARQTKTGVSINITGQRKTIKHAFIAAGRRGGFGTSAGVSILGSSGHMGVFVRGRYQGTDLTFRHKRVRRQGSDLPIEEVMTTSVFGMITNSRVQKSVADKIDSDFAPRLLHELRRLVSGA